MKKMLQALPHDFADAVVIVLHRHRDSDLGLIEFLQEDVAVSVTEIVDKQPIEPGYAYVAPPDYHVMIDGERFALSIDDPVRYARPSVDVLFESAAFAGHLPLVAVILTGGGGDGAIGCAAIERAGGKVLVQSPDEAVSRDMPEAALAQTRSAEVHVLEQLSRRIVELARPHEERA